MISFLKTIIYEPLYNALILILNIPYLDAGLAAIILTILVKIILFPVSKKATITQVKMRAVGNELKEIKEKYPDKETQALKVMEFYRKHKLNPFGSILGIIIQIPIVYSLYHIFLYSGLPTVDLEMLYSFIPAPTISMNFLGLIDISKKSIILALLASISSFFQMHLANKDEGPAEQNQSQDLSKMVMKQMKYTFPVIVLLISWKISGVVALYWFVSNIAGIVQDKIIKRKLAVNS